MFVGSTAVRAYAERFYADQLYNPYADEYYDLFNLLFRDHHKVFGCLTFLTHLMPERASEFLVEGHAAQKVQQYDAQRGCWRCLRAVAYHQIKVFTQIPRARYSDPRILKPRNFVYNVIRVHQCTWWLEHVRMLIRHQHWADDVVIKAIQDQLEAWFKTVSHEDVRFSCYLPGARNSYRVCWG